MARFHLMHCVPSALMHGLKGYTEVIESVDWGLNQLGHQVSYSLNRAESTATNIIFGAQVLPLDFLQQLPAGTIVYNFEQMRGLQKDQIKPTVHFYADNFRVWEYSKFNLDTWKLFGFDHAKLVPVGYAPNLTRIPKPAIQDIDILIYGSPGNNRLHAFHKLADAGLTVVYACGLYGQARDELIARAKIILNINVYFVSQIFEIVRVSYLLANRKLVVSILDANTGIEEDVSGSVVFTSIEKLVDDCVQLLVNDAERSRLENIGFENFAKRDIKEILVEALG